MYFRHKYKTHHKLESGKLFAYLALTIGLGQAAFWTIFPQVTENVFNSEAMVGYFFAIISFIQLSP